jgi:hypothetical protein
MGMFRWSILAAAAVTLASCATPYQQQGVLGGFDVKELRPDVYRVSFGGNGYTTRESVQVYWLHRCAEVAIEKGFAGFEILSDMQFVMQRPTSDDRPASPLTASFTSLRAGISVTPDDAAEISVWGSQGDFATGPAGPIRIAAAGPVIFYSGGGPPKPAIEGDVHFLSAPVESSPPKIFNAKALLAQLDPLIKSEKCGLGNICPHVHEYLLPKGKLR